MIVVDSSAWVEFLRATESPADLALTRLLEARAPLAITGIVAAEVLAGARDQLDHHRIRKHLLGCRMLDLDGLRGFETAAKLVQECRAKGVTPSVTDCLVAAPARTAGAPVLHADKDFDAIAAVTELEIYPLDGG